VPVGPGGLSGLGLELAQRRLWAELVRLPLGLELRRLGLVRPKLELARLGLGPVQQRLGQQRARGRHGAPQT